jgi:drug/metabolite transporter (DMT)-like permease
VSAAATVEGPTEGRGLLAGTLLLVFASCCFGAISTLTVVATGASGGRAGLPLAVVLFWRYAVAAPFFLPLVVRDARRAAGGVDAGGVGAAGRAPLPRTPGAFARTLLVAGGGQAAVAGLTLSSLRWVSVGTLAFLFYTFPAWVTLIAAARGTERLDSRKLLAVALSFAGIACTVGLPGGAGAAGSGSIWPGVALALGAAVVYALYIPYLGQLTGRTSPGIASAFVAGGAAVIFAVWAGDALLTTPTPAQAAAVATMAVVCTVVAFLAFMRGLARLGPVRTAIVTTVEPLFTVALGAVALDQPVTPGTLLGGALVAGAVILLQLPARRA